MNPLTGPLITAELIAAGPVARIMSGMYTIQAADASGKVTGSIPFLPKPEQEKMLRWVYENGYEFIVCIKARQYGMSTLIAIMILDCLLFGGGVQASIVDQTSDDAKKKLAQKIKFAYEKLQETLPPFLRGRWQVVQDNQEAFSLKLKNAPKGVDNSESVVFAGKRARGGTNHFLHISEWGEIQLKDPLRSTEILTGALPSAKHAGCVTLVETTWKGGRTGEIYPFVVEAARIPECDKSPNDPRVMFIGWHSDENNRDFGPEALITPETHTYCDKVERLCEIKLDNAQRLWWQKAKRKYGILMSSEFPSTVDEAFEAPHQSAVFDAEGVKYQEQLAVALTPDIMYGDITVIDKSAQWRATEKEQATFRFWELPKLGESYLISADFCVGKQAEGSAGVLDANYFSVWRAGRVEQIHGQPDRYHKPKRVAACMPEDRSITTETIRRIVALHYLYGDCMVVPEINNKDDIAQRLMAAGVTRMYHQSIGADGARPGESKEDIVHGWNTNPGTRKQILDYLQEIVIQQGYIGSCAVHAHQLGVFVRNKKGKAEAASGEHDDSIIETAIGVFNLPHATPYKVDRTIARAKAGRGGWVDTLIKGHRGT